MNATEHWFREINQRFRDKKGKEKLQKFLQDSTILIEFTSPPTETNNALISFAEDLKKNGIQNISIAPTKENPASGLRIRISYWSNTVREELNPEESARFLAIIYQAAFRHQILSTSHPPVGPKGSPFV